MGLTWAANLVPLIDQGKIEEAKAALQSALSTLVEELSVLPLPVLRAKLLLKRAEPLVEDGQRSEASNAPGDIVERSPAAVGNGRTAGLW